MTGALAGSVLQSDPFWFIKNLATNVLFISAGLRGPPSRLSDMTFPSCQDEQWACCRHIPALSFTWCWTKWQFMWFLAVHNKGSAHLTAAEVERQTATAQGCTREAQSKVCVNSFKIGIHNKELLNYFYWAFHLQYLIVYWNKIQGKVHI